MNDAETLVQEVTDLLMGKGCAVTRPAMLELAIYILEREKLAAMSTISSLSNQVIEDSSKRGEE